MRHMCELWKGDELSGAEFFACDGVRVDFFSGATYPQLLTTHCFDAYHVNATERGRHGLNLCRTMSCWQVANKWFV